MNPVTALLTTADRLQAAPDPRQPLLVAGRRPDPCRGHVQVGGEFSVVILSVIAFWAGRHT